jgi:hypothetical protein
MIVVIQGGEMKKTLFTLLALLLVPSLFPVESGAQMQSANYRITTTVVSGGGGSMNSTSFQINGTLGQPTPIMEDGMDPFSDNYSLLPGFWYTLTSGGEEPIIDDIVFDGCISDLCESTIAVTAHDPAGGNLSYAWTAEDGGTILGAGDTVDFDPPNASLPPACLPFRVTVAVTSDVSGLTTEQTVDILVKLAGDADGNGVVNIIDKVMVRNAFGSSSSQPADVNCDNVVNILDKVIVRNQFGQSGCACP